jgi:hypothetical protein
MRNAISSALAGAALLGLSVSAQAIPNTTLRFVHPTGTVTGDVPIEVWVRLTVDPLSSEDLVVDTGAPGVGFGLPDLFEATGMYLNLSFTCTGNFGANCTQGPPYDFQFGTNSEDLTRPTWAAQSLIEIAAGASRDFYFGSFIPDPNPAAAGNYVFHNAELFVAVFGQQYEEVPLLDDNGDPILDDQENPIFTLAPVGEPKELNFSVGQTCPTFEDSCGFSRTVLAPIPEPQTYALFGAGLGLLGWSVSRRRRRSAV